VLIVDESIVSSIFLSADRVYCHFCFKHCPSLIPCNRCGYVSAIFISKLFVEINFNEYLWLLI
jgi:hypothetical protein